MADRVGFGSAAAEALSGLICEREDVVDVLDEYGPCRVHVPFRGRRVVLEVRLEELADAS